MAVSEFPSGSPLGAPPNPQELFQFTRLATDSLASTPPGWLVAEASTTKRMTVQARMTGDGTLTPNNTMDFNSDVMVEVIGALSTQGWQVDAPGGGAFGSPKTSHTASGEIQFDVRSPAVMPAPGTYSGIRCTHQATSVTATFSIVVT